MKPSTVTATLVRPIDSDDRIVDVARVSFSKQAGQYTQEENDRLLKYLANNGHWSPFGHARVHCWLYFSSMWECLTFLTKANLAGFSWTVIEEGSCGGVRIEMNGSLWAWHENFHLIAWEPARNLVAFKANHRFPRSCRALGFPSAPDPSFGPVRNTDFPSWNYSTKRAVKPVKDTSSLRSNEYFSFHVVAPCFVARQAAKHQVHMCWNEESRRYVDDPPVWFTHDGWRGRPTGGMKQGSSGILNLPTADRFVAGLEQESRMTYQYLLDNGVAPEQARAYLLQSQQFEWIWTGSLDAWARVCRLRLDSHAQKEIRDLAAQIDSALTQELGDCKWRKAT